MGCISETHRAQEDINTIGYFILVLNLLTRYKEEFIIRDISVYC